MIVNPDVTDMDVYTS